MGHGIVILELVLRGVAIGAMASWAIGLWRVAQAKPVGVAAILLGATAVAHVLENSEALRAQSGDFGALINLVSLGGTGFVWLFVVTLFDDRPIEPRTLAPAAVLIALGILASVSGARPVWLVHKLSEAGLALHALSVVVRTWRGDLVEARLRLRTPFLAIVSVYVALMVGLQIGVSFGLEIPMNDLINAGAVAAMSLAGVAIFLRAPLDGRLVNRPIEMPPPDHADRLALDRLNQAMDKDEIWRREGLTISGLADALALPDYRLRQLINGQLGFRNFPAFVNARRIEAAKRVLSDPTQARTTVAAIAFDLGFGSLGPFNRAFKAATGVTPTEFRRAQGIAES
jgi:AraC-like DNA-binding protein